MVQATAIAIDGRAVMLFGSPGVGKSDLALRLIDTGAALIGDDVVSIAIVGARLVVAAASTGRPRLHVADIGIVRAARSCASAPLALVIRCVADARPDRAATSGVWSHQGLSVPQVALVAHHASAPAKLRLALARWGL